MFGKPVAVKKSGLQFRIPFLQKLRDVSPAWGNLTNKDGYFIELTEQLLDTQPRSCITKDNATMQMNCIMRWAFLPRSVPPDRGQGACKPGRNLRSGP